MDGVAGALVWISVDSVAGAIMRLVWIVWIVWIVWLVHWCG